MTPTLKHTTYSQQNYSNYIKYYMLLNQEFSINGYMIDRSQSQNAKKKNTRERQQSHGSMGQQHPGLVCSTDGQLLCNIVMLVSV